MFRKPCMWKEQLWSLQIFIGENWLLRNTKRWYYQTNVMIIPFFYQITRLYAYHCGKHPVFYLACGTAYNEQNERPLKLFADGSFHDTNKFRWAYLDVELGCTVKVCEKSNMSGSCKNHGDDWDRHWLGWWWQNDVKSYQCTCQLTWKSWACITLTVFEGSYL